MDNFNLSRVRNMLPSLTSQSSSQQPDEPINEKAATHAKSQSTSDPQPDPATAETSTASSSAPTVLDPRPLTPDSQKPKSNLDLVRECDNFPYFIHDSDLFLSHVNTYYALHVSAYPSLILGYILPSVASVFRGLPAWSIDDDERSLTLVQGENEEQRSRIVAATTRAMRETGFFSVLKGWRDELYPVYGPKGEVLFSIERAASGLFGIITYGAHMTVYSRSKSGGVGDGKGEMKIWVPRRAKNKSTYGGMLDNTVAGGLATGEIPFEGLVREASEEASLPEKLVRERAKAVGTVTYFHIRDERAGGETGLLQPEFQYVYDLELEEDEKDENGEVISCKPSDDEVEEFKVMTVAEIKESLRKGEFKPNCALVLLDFFVRHGILHQGNEESYSQIVARLHRLLEFPLR